MNSKLKEYMKPSDRKALGALPTFHQYCLDKCGVARAGKTARDRAKREAAYQKALATQ